MFKSIKEVESSMLGKYAKEQIINAFKTNNRITNTSSDMEQSFVCKPLGTKENPRFINPVYINIRSTRKRQTDYRAISEKAVVDSLIKTGILKDDSKKEIAGIKVFEPEISEEEKTIIEIQEV